MSSAQLKYKSTKFPVETKRRSSSMAIGPSSCVCTSREFEPSHLLAFRFSHLCSSVDYFFVCLAIFCYSLFFIWVASLFFCSICVLGTGPKWTYVRPPWLVFTSRGFEPLPISSLFFFFFLNGFFSLVCVRVSTFCFFFLSILCYSLFCSMFGVSFLLFLFYNVPGAGLNWTYYFINKFQGRQPWVQRILGQYSSLQAALLVLVIYNIDEFLFGGSYFWSTIMVSVGIFTLGGEFWAWSNITSILFFTVLQRQQRWPAFPYVLYLMVGWWNSCTCRGWRWYCQVAYFSNKKDVCCKLLSPKLLRLVHFIVIISGFQSHHNRSRGPYKWSQIFIIFMTDL